MKTNGKNPILLVDDDPDCRLIIRDTIENVGFAEQIFEVSSGEEALAFARREPPFENAPRAGLIYLDIEMPGLSGVEVLRILKSDEKTRDIPVVMMTAIDEEKEKRDSALYGANSYCVKPSNHNKLIETVIKATDYWLTIHQSPDPVKY